MANGYAQWANGYARTAAEPEKPTDHSHMRAQTKNTHPPRELAAHGALTTLSSAILQLPPSSQLFATRTSRPNSLSKPLAEEVRVWTDARNEQGPYRQFRRSRDNGSTLPPVQMYCANVLWHRSARAPHTRAHRGGEQKQTSNCCRSVTSRSNFEQRG